MKRHMLFAFLAAVPASLALAQNPPAPPPPMPSATESDASRQQQKAETDRERGANATFQALDSNADGRVSPQEAAADNILTEVFTKADRNSDGFVDGVEYRRYAQARVKAQESAPR
jgi:hypothetical protein